MTPTPYYEDDLVTLYHGDSTMITAWLEADALVTDPPYGRSWRQGRLKDKRGGYKAESAARAGIVGDGSTAVRDTILTMWGPDKPAVLFGDLMLAPPTGTRLAAVYAKPANSGMRGAIGGLRRDLEAIYLCGGTWESGLGGDSSLFSTHEPSMGGRRRDHRQIRRAPARQTAGHHATPHHPHPGHCNDRGPVRRLWLHPRRRRLPRPQGDRRGVRGEVLRDGRPPPVPGAPELRRAHGR